MAGGLNSYKLPVASLKDDVCVSHNLECIIFKGSFVNLLHNAHRTCKLVGKHS